MTVVTSGNAVWVLFHYRDYLLVAHCEPWPVNTKASCGCVKHLIGVDRVVNTLCGLALLFARAKDLHRCWVLLAARV